MHLTTVLSACALPLLAAAQYGGYGDSGGGDKTSSAAASAPSIPADTDTHKNVVVAINKTFAFGPASLAAKNGTLVTFWFPDFPGGHSVSQSSFADPCVTLQANGSAPAGFDSGLTAKTQFTIQITDDTKPIWYHCKGVGHCGQGMVGSINAPTTGNTFDAFQTKAKSLGGNAPTEKDNGFVKGGVNGVASAAPSAATGASGSNNGAAKSLGSSTLVLAGVAFIVSLL